MKKFLLRLFAVFLFFAFSYINLIAQDSVRIKGLNISNYYNEQIITFNYDPEIRVHINAPSPQKFDINKPTAIALFALPNGNTIEQTAGKILLSGDDWHYDIQHIAAQTRFIRQNDSTQNLITVYLESKQLSWPTWNSKYTNRSQILNNLVNYIISIFKQYNPYIILTGHSGGGSLTFSFLDYFNEIPSYVKRISFLDSDYNYVDSYGSKIKNWLNAANDNYLCVIAYNDSIALYNGAPIVSATGGTWYRSHMMKNYLEKYFPIDVAEDSLMFKFSGLSGRIKFFMKKNPDKLILHTVQVERNGFIEGILSGTQNDEKNYTYYGDRAYSNLVQNNITAIHDLTIPPRSSDFITGSVFMNNINSMTFADREQQIYNEISKGNIPDFLRNIKTINATFNDTTGIAHNIQYKLLPDYFAIGSDSDFCRIPMGPITAQKLANLFGGILPTPKLVDNISVNSTFKLEPIPYAPVGNENELVSKFVLHNTDIEAARISAGGTLGQLIDGIKKDVVLSNKITDPSKPGHVVIYGWHKLDGSAIQPVTNVHINSYVDYSHGIRLLNNEVMFDGSIKKITDILKDKNLYKTLSNEVGPMQQPTYLTDTTSAPKPTSFKINSETNGTIHVMVKPNSSVTYYKVMLSNDCVNFNRNYTYNSNDFTIDNLNQDSIYFIKLIAGNVLNESPASEVLGTSAKSSKILIVNGFDRATAGNTYNFIKQHAFPLYNNGYSFNSCTNEAVVDGIVKLTDYSIVDYILGEESTADETFSSSEQVLISDYLKAGKGLFVTGSEIAWDLDAKGSTTDKNFIWNDLKVKYAYDNPGTASGTVYNVNPVSTSIFGNLASFSFDNGTKGTYNVVYPDVFTNINGSVPVLLYQGYDQNYGNAGSLYTGTISGGTKTSSVICLGIPFETIYPEDVRNNMMKDVVEYFTSVTNVKNSDKAEAVNDYSLFQNYPNPFNSSTSIQYSLKEKSNVNFTIYDALGKQILEIKKGMESAGVHSMNFNAENLSSGVYFYKIDANSFSKSMKMILLK